MKRVRIFDTAQIHDVIHIYYIYIIYVILSRGKSTRNLLLFVGTVSLFAEKTRIVPGGIENKGKKREKKIGKRPLSGGHFDTNKKEQLLLSFFILPVFPIHQL